MHSCAWPLPACYHTSSMCKSRICHAGGHEPLLVRLVRAVMSILVVSQQPAAKASPATAARWAHQDSAPYALISYHFLSLHARTTRDNHVAMLWL